MKIELQEDIWYDCIDRKMEYIPYNLFKRVFIRVEWRMDMKTACFIPIKKILKEFPKI